MSFLRSGAEHIDWVSDSELEQLQEDEWADSCVDSGDEWVLDYVVQDREHCSDTPTEHFIPIAAIHSLLHILLFAQAPCRILPSKRSFPGRREKPIVLSMVKLHWV